MQAQTSSVLGMVALAALACRGAAPGPQGSPASQREAGSGSAVTNPATDSLDLALIVPRSVRRREPVPIGFRLRNRTGRPLDLYLRGHTPTLDVVIARPGGQVVWRRLEGEMVPAIVHLRTLAAGEALEMETSWNQQTGTGPLQPGEYTARGLLLAEGEPLESPVAVFQVTGGGAEAE